MGTGSSPHATQLIVWIADLIGLVGQAPGWEPRLQLRVWAALTELDRHDIAEQLFGTGDAFLSSAPIAEALHADRTLAPRIEQAVRRLAHRAEVEATS